ncbi:hypothetical protein Q4I30_007700 [Leishmania utingensis]|uniref:Uncharacterized protein n=1 Tax=Leishmania utingensis TaxID=653362 RepID=A0AAW3A043_9TRYP
MSTLLNEWTSAAQSTKRAPPKNILYNWTSPSLILAFVSFVYARLAVGAACATPTAAIMKCYAVVVLRIFFTAALCVRVCFACAPKHSKTMQFFLPLIGLPLRV